MTIKRKVKDFLIDGLTVESMTRFLERSRFSELDEALEEFIGNGDLLLDFSYREFKEGYSFSLRHSVNLGDGNLISYIIEAISPTETFYFRMSGDYSSWGDCNWNSLDEVYLKKDIQIKISYFTEKVDDDANIDDLIFVDSLTV